VGCVRHCLVCGLLTNGSGVGRHSLQVLENSLDFTEFAIFCLGTAHDLSS
jgi:hypothetical protein